MPWGEAIRHTHTLSDDPSSHIMAAVRGWDAPVSREWLILAETFDILNVANWQRGSGRRTDLPKPHPRPFRDPNSKRRGRTTRPRAEVLAILARHGHVFEEA